MLPAELSGRAWKKYSQGTNFGYVYMVILDSDQGLELWAMYHSNRSYNPYIHWAYIMTNALALDSNFWSVIPIQVTSVK